MSAFLSVLLFRKRISIAAFVSLVERCCVLPPLLPTPHHFFLSNSSCSVPCFSCAMASLSPFFFSCFNPLMSNRLISISDLLNQSSAIWFLRLIFGFPEIFPFRKSFGCGMSFLKVPFGFQVLFNWRNCYWKSQNYHGIQQNLQQNLRVKHNQKWIFSALAHGASNLLALFCDLINCLQSSFLPDRLSKATLANCLELFSPRQSKATLTNCVQSSFLSGRAKQPSQTAYRALFPDRLSKTTLANCLQSSSLAGRAKQPLQIAYRALFHWQSKATLKVPTDLFSLWQSKANNAWGKLMPHNCNSVRKQRHTQANASKSISFT